MDSKKRNFIILVCLGFFLLLLLVLIFFQIGPSEETAVSPTPSPEEKFTKERVFLLTPKEKDIVSFWFDQEKFLYFFNKEGELFKLDLLTSQMASQDISFPGIKKTIISPDKEKLVVFWQEKEKPPFFVNLKEKTSRVLPSRIISSDFSLDSKKLVYLKEEGNQAAIFSLDLDNWQEEKIVDFPVLDTEIKVIANDRIILFEKPSCLLEGHLYFLDLNSKKLSFWLKGKGLEVNLSPKRDKVLVSFGGLRLLSLYSLETQELLKDFDFFTLPSKCGFDKEETFLVCARPKDFGSKSCLPDDYWKGKIGFKEDLVKIDLMNFSKNTLIEDKNSDLNSVFVGQKGVYSFDRKTQKIYLFPW